MKREIFDESNEAGKYMTSACIVELSGERSGNETPIQRILALLCDNAHVIPAGRYASKQQFATSGNYTT